MPVAPLALALLLVLTLAAPASAGPAGEPVEVASGLATPWDVVRPGDGRTLVVERPGRIRVVEGPGAGSVLLDMDASVAKFLGLVAHPEYATNKLLYLYVNDGPGNQILRLRDSGSALTVERTIFSGIATDGNHDGGRMAFGPDGHLYVTTGDVHDPARPQDLQSLNGKILRLLAPGTDADGGFPADNPFVGEGGNARFVWSYGHRHPQGLVFDAAGRLYSSEHGPSGERYGTAYPGGNGRCCRDELNLIEKGANYGWPLISGDESAPGMRAPIATSGAGSTWAPAGLAIGSDGHLYMPALAGMHLREFTLSGDGRTVVAQAEHYRNRFGRLRAAKMTCDGLYFTQDGGSVDLLRVAIAPAPVCPEPGGGEPPGSGEPPGGGASSGGVATSGGGTSGGGTPTTGPPLAPSTPSGAAPPRGIALGAALQNLVARGARAARTRGLRRVKARAGGFTAGRVTLRLQRRRGSPRTLATGFRRIASRRAITFRPRLTRTGRKVLRKRGRARLVLVAVHMAAGGGDRTTARKRFTIRRR